MMMAIIHCDNGCSVNHVHTLFFVRKNWFSSQTLRAAMYVHNVVTILPHCKDCVIVQILIISMYIYMWYITYHRHLILHVMQKKGGGTCKELVIQCKVFD